MRNFYFAGNSDNYFPFFVTFPILLLESGVFLPFNNLYAPNLKRNHKSNREKSARPIKEYSLNFVLCTILIE